jgi:hypothetical protein
MGFFTGAGFAMSENKSNCHGAEAPLANDENGYFLGYLKNVAGNVVLPPHHNWIPIFIGDGVQNPPSNSFNETCYSCIDI